MRLITFTIIEAAAGVGVCILLNDIDKLQEVGANAPMQKLFLVTFTLLAACGVPSVSVGPQSNGGTTGDPNAPTVTSSVTPNDSTFNGELTVQFSTNRDASILYTLDGADPSQSMTAVTTKAPFSLVLKKTTIIRFFAKASNATETTIHKSVFTRAGGIPGTISGVIVTGDFGADKKVALKVNNLPQVLNAGETAHEFPFVLEKLESGTFSLVGAVDRNDDGLFLPFIDIESENTTVTLDLSDPFKASAENIRIYVGAATPDSGAIAGTVTVPHARLGQTLRVVPLSPEVFTGGVDFQNVLTKLQQGDGAILQPGVTEYPYGISKLDPGTYVPVPALFTVGFGGVSINILANILKTTSIKAGQTVSASFEYGPITLSGTISSTSAPSVLGPLSAGVLAAKSIAIVGTSQVVLLPVVFTQSDGVWRANYAVEDLRANSPFKLRVFTGTNVTTVLTSALAWSLNPFASEPAQATANVKSTDLVLDFDSN